MSSKHNHPQPSTSSLLTSDMGSGLQWAVKGVNQSCEVERANSSDVRVSSSPGEWIVRKECLVWLLFRIDGRCQFFSEELKRQGGDICIIECEYSSFSDGWSYPNHGTCLDWQSPFHWKQLDVWTGEPFPLLITNATLEKPLIFQQSILSHNTRMRSKAGMWPLVVSEKKPQSTDSSCSSGMEKCDNLHRIITTLPQFLLLFDLHDEFCLN